ncbi:MAG TPA: hypothetical protein VH391_00065 [Solirubrobacterales bacterium]
MTRSGRQRKIAFYGGSQTDYELFMMRPDGTHDHSLTDEAVNERSPVFSPNGNWIAFGTDDTKIERIRVDGFHRRNLTADSAGNADASWQPRPRRRHH